MSAMILPLPRMITYSGVKSVSKSTPIFDLGRSLTWPTDACTVTPPPRYFLIVLALAGDSTTTRALPPAVFFPEGAPVAFAAAFFGAAFLAPDFAWALGLALAPDFALDLALVLAAVRPFGDAVSTSVSVLVSVFLAAL